MALDIYSTAAQLKAIEVMPRESTFLWELFAKEEGVVEEDKAIYDFRKGVARMAPVVHEMTGGVPMKRDGYKTNQIDFCTIAPERIIEVPHITARYFGEKILGGMTPEERERKILAQDQAELLAAIQRRREWMARQILLTGKLDIFTYTSEGKNVTAKTYADFGFTNTFTPDTDWDESGADIEGDMHSILDMVYEGGGNAEVIVMNPDVASAMLSNSTYLNQHDNRWIDPQMLTLAYKGNAVRYLGRNTDGIDMYSYAGKFLDDDGTAKYVIPSGKLICGGKNILKCVHGPVIQVENEGTNATHAVYFKKEVPLRHGSIDGNAIMNRITSRPALMPYNVDAWVVATVL